MTKEQTENPNENCLEGMQCPSCGSFGPFNIEMTVVCMVYDNGTEHPEGDSEWNDESHCLCTQCDHEGAVKEFRQD